MSAVICEDCGGYSKVIANLPYKLTVKRRRKCQACGARWSTIEVKGIFVLDTKTRSMLMREGKRVKAQERQAAAAGQGTGQTESVPSQEERTGSTAKGAKQ